MEQIISGGRGTGKPTGCMNTLILFAENEALKKENEQLKAGIKHYKRCMQNIISIATECNNSKKWNYKE